jgi:rRNA maturation endonuclease Nob1
MVISNILLCDGCGITIKEENKCPKCGGELVKIGWIQNGK